MRNERNSCARTPVVCLGIAWLIVTLSGSVSASTNRIGVTHATLEWSESTGRVDGYLVYSQRNGGDLLFEAYTPDNRYTVEAGYGDEVVVRVRAVGRTTSDGAYVASALSDPSAPIRFFAAYAWNTNSVALMASHRESDLQLYLFRPNSRYRLPGRSASWIPVAAGHFTQDSLSDVVWRHVDTGVLEIASVSDPDDAATASNPSELASQELKAVGDLDGDGDLDLVMYDAARDRARIWRVSSNGSTIRRSTRLSALDGSNIVDVADLDGDGDEEIWTFDPVAERLLVYRGDGSGPIAGALVDAFDRVDRIEDYDGDGSPDVLWRTRSGGFGLTYLGAGSQPLDRVAFPITPLDADLEVVGVAPMSTPGRLEVILSNRVDRSMWILIPSLETASNRFRIVDADEAAFMPIEILD